MNLPSATSTPRQATIERNTTETQLHLRLNLDGQGEHRIESGVGFLDHMLALFAFHGGMDLELRCRGDLHIDAHHSVEDLALGLGQALDQALGTRTEIQRYGTCHMPMDETLARVVIDLSGRPVCCFQAHFDRAQIGALDTELIGHFFHSFAMRSRSAVHLAVLYGENDHHRCEALFKGFGRALAQAVARTPGRTGVPSTKGVL